MQKELENKIIAMLDRDRTKHSKDLLLRTQDLLSQSQSPSRNAIGNRQSMKSYYEKEGGDGNIGSGMNEQKILNKDLQPRQDITEFSF